MQQYAWLPLWRASTILPSQSLLQQRSPYFRLDLPNIPMTDDEKLKIAINLLIIFGECSKMTDATTFKDNSTRTNHSSLDIKNKNSTTNTNTNTNATTANNTNTINNTLCNDWLPGLQYWPIFLTDNSNNTTTATNNNNKQNLLVTGDLIVWPSRNFATLPHHIRLLLRPYMKTVLQRKLSNTSNSSQNKKNNSNSNNYYLLHNDIETKLLNVIQDKLIESNPTRSNNNNNNSNNKNNSREKQQARSQNNWSNTSNKSTANNTNTNNKTANNILSDNSPDDQFIYACYEMAENTFPNNFIDVEEACRELFSTWQYKSLLLSNNNNNNNNSNSSTTVSTEKLLNNSSSGDVEIEAIISFAISIFQWAYTSGLPQVISFVLVSHQIPTITPSFLDSNKVNINNSNNNNNIQIPSGHINSNKMNELYLAPISEAYLSQIYTGSNTLDQIQLELLQSNINNTFQINRNNTNNTNINTTKNQSSNLLKFISSKYLINTSADESQYNLKSYAKFLQECGAHTVPSFSSAVKIANHTDIQTVLKELPKLRTSNTSIPIQLPYNLGTMSRKHYYLIDLSLTNEWISILKLCTSSNNIILAKHVSELFASLLQHAGTLLNTCSDFRFINDNIIMIDH